MRLIALRWALLLVFLVPIFDVQSPFLLSRGYPWFLVRMLISCAACALLLTRLDRPLLRTLWMWIILLLFLVGYYIKSFRFAANLNSADFMGYYPELYWISVDTISDGLFYVTVAFVAFCATCWVVLDPRLSPPLEPLREVDVEASKDHGIFWLATVVTVLAVAEAYLQLKLGFGIMGLETERLPYKLDTLLTRYRHEIAPTVLYMAIWALDRSKKRSMWLLMLAYLVLLAVVEGFVSTSRGCFVRMLSPVCFLWLLTGRVTKQRVYFMGLTIAATILLHPFFSAMRTSRIESTDGSLDLVPANSSMTYGDDLIESVSLTVSILITRVSGVDGIWYAMDSSPSGMNLEAIYSHLVEEPIHVFFTRRIVGVTSLADFRAPGAYATFMLLGGSSGMVIYGIIYLLGCSWSWNLIARNCRSAPVVLSLFMFIIWNNTMEGGMQLQSLVMLVADYVVAEWVCRTFLVLDGPAPREAGRAIVSRASPLPPARVVGA